MPFKRLFFIATGAFFGLMVPVVGGLIFPSILINGGKHFVASPSDKIILEKHGYSYKPGQSGTQYNFFRVSPDGKKKDVTFELIGCSVLVYSLIFIFLCFIFYFIYLTCIS